MKWIFWLSTAVISYTHVGYLAWLWLRAKLKPWPVRRGSAKPTVSVVMAVRNEDQVLERKLQNLFQLDYPPELCQVVVVSDGSTDGTEQILRKHANEPRLLAVMNQFSRGKATALNHGIELADGEILVFTDARQMIEVGALRLLNENFADPDVGCVSGELMLGDVGIGETAQGMGLYWRIEKKVRELEAASNSVVGATGAIYAVRRELLTSTTGETIPAETILDDVYVPMQVVRQGKRVVFDPRARAWDSPNLGDGREFARKVRTLGGNYQLLQIAPWILTRANPIRFEFVSHKLMRLGVPVALVAALVSSALSTGVFLRGVFVLQLLFYALSVLAVVDFPLGFLTRLSDAALTFITLNGAAAVAFTNFVTGKKVAWTR